MLNELKKLNFSGGKDELLFFICDVVGNKKIRVRDAEVICSHAPGKRFLSVKDLISYCLVFGWVETDKDGISLSTNCIEDISNKDLLNEKLVFSTVNQLFAEDVFSSLLFSYDAVQGCYSFRNELLPLSFSVVRNVLISQGFLITKRDPQGTKFYISPAYDSLIAKHCSKKRKQFSLEKLKKQLEDNEIAGEKAESFVLAFEKARVGSPLCDSIKRISEIDVSAGYDIVSFNSAHSQVPDRFIEVKAISSSGFFWSKNEYEIAKLKGELYFIYLVELNRIDEPDYAPEMIRNPAMCIMESDGWFVEAQSYHIKHI